VLKTVDGSIVISRQLHERGFTGGGPTHFVTTTDFYSYVSRQTDRTSERPFVLPEFAPGMPSSNGTADGAQGDVDRPKSSRFTGTVLPGGVLWFTDDNIEVVGTTNDTRLIVSAPDQTIVIAESEPVLGVYPETNAAGALKVTLILREYVGIATSTRRARRSSAAGHTTALV
jgi:hypothetical protein